MDNGLNKFEIGKRIREARESMHLSRDAFAERIPMSPSFLADVEGGTKGISLEKFVRIIKVLDVSADYILYGDSEDSEEDEKRKLIFERIKGDLAKYDTDSLMYMASAVRSFTFIATRSGDVRK